VFGWLSISNVGFNVILPGALLKIEPYVPNYHGYHLYLVLGEDKSAYWDLGRCYKLFYLGFEDINTGKLSTAGAYSGCKKVVLHAFDAIALKKTFVYMGKEE